MTIDVFFNNDGNSSDLVSYMLLRLSPKVRLLGTTVTNADCRVISSYKMHIALEKLLELDILQMIGVWENEMPNSFPDLWRDNTDQFLSLSCLQQFAHKEDFSAKHATSVMADVLEKAQNPVVVIETGPLTVIADLLAKYPHLAAKIKQVVTMAGAVRVKGNVAQDGHDGSAEWNVYCDPFSFQKLLQSNLNIRLISLDVCNLLPVDKKFMQLVAEQSANSLACRAVKEMYDLQELQELFLWDETTVMSILNPGLFQFEDVYVKVEIDGPSQGRTVECPKAQGGRLIQMATSANSEAVLQALLGVLALK